MVYVQKITGWSLSRYSKQNWILFLHFEDESAKYIMGDSLFQIFIKLIKHM